MRDMSGVSDIEKAIKELPPGELEKFRAWFTEFNAAEWDRRLAEDVAAGRLDSLAEEAVADFRKALF